MPYRFATTCSDASEYGGGVCAADHLSEVGLYKLALLGASVEGVGRDNWILVELCCGIGAGRRAMERLGVEVACRVFSDTKETALAVIRSAWPGGIEWGDIRVVSISEVKAVLLEAPLAQQMC